MKSLEIGVPRGIPLRPPDDGDRFWRQGRVRRTTDTSDRKELAMRLEKERGWPPPAAGPILDWARLASPAHASRACN